ncbi:hypothetical protein GE061_001680 [Apolygus lucorum]|uniref:CCHC-type domain-containing protein n=1 Tax=Apolygus lucorum TaxID=248454 RepID=A0A8S9YCL3_APOLU|nr:hypothetical protein GE061_001680 [Apolygus lucorum]
MMLTEFKALLQQPSSALPSGNAIASMEQSTNPNDNSNNQKAYGIPGGTQTIPFLKPKPYDGTVDWDSYLTQFELIAVRNGWDNVTKVAVLGAALCGPALTLLSELHHPIGYDDLVSALDARYGIKNQMQLHLVLLQCRVQKPNEDIRTYHREMQELGRKAWPQAKGSMDSVIVTHFMNGLRDLRIRERVLTAWPETMTAALTVALRMEAVSRLAPPKMASQCSQASVYEPPCMAVQSTIKKHQGVIQHRQLVCWRCDEAGHTLRNCPTRRQISGSKMGNEPRSE